VPGSRVASREYRLLVSRHARAAALACVVAAAATAALLAALTSGGGARPEPVLTAGVSCGGVVFPAAALKAPPGAELLSDPASRALAALLAGQPGIPLPRHGWKVLLRRRAEVLYGHADRSGRVTLSALIVRMGDTWTGVDYGDCVASLVRPGFEIPQFLLAPRVRLTARTRVLQLLLQSGTCSFANVTDAQRSFDHSDVRYTRRAVVLTAYMRPGQAARNAICAGVGLDVPVSVTLSRALGHRVVLDGSFVPPAAPGQYP
jgi:hypothetical protein